MQQKPGTIEQRPVWPPIVHNCVYQQQNWNRKWAVKSGEWPCPSVLAWCPLPSVRVVTCNSATLSKQPGDWCWHATTRNTTTCSLQTGASFIGFKFLWEISISGDKLSKDRPWSVTEACYSAQLVLVSVSCGSHAGIRPSLVELQTKVREDFTQVSTHGR